MTIQYIDSGFHPVKDIWFKDPGLGDVPIRAINRGNTRIWTRGSVLVENFSYGTSGYLSEVPGTLWRDGECTDPSRSRAYLVGNGDVRGKSTTKDGTYDSRVWMKTPFTNYDVTAKMYLGSVPSSDRGVSLYVGNPDASSYELSLENNELTLKRYKVGETTGSWTTTPIRSALNIFSISREYNYEGTDIIEVRQYSSDINYFSLYKAYLTRNEKISSENRYKSSAYNYVGLRTRFKRENSTNYGPPAITRVEVNDAALTHIPFPP